MKAKASSAKDKYEPPTEITAVELAGRIRAQARVPLQGTIEPALWLVISFFVSAPRELPAAG